MKFRYTMVYAAAFFDAFSQTTDNLREQLLELVKQYRQAKYYSYNEEMRFLERQYDSLISEYISISKFRQIIFKGTLSELVEVF